MRRAPVLAACAAALLAALAPGRAAALPNNPNVPHAGWSVCFQSAIASCTDLFLVTWQIVDPVTLVPQRTAMSVYARHQSLGGVQSGLMNFAFHFTPQGGTADAAPVQGEYLRAAFGAPDVPPAAQQAWTSRGAVDLGDPTNPFVNYVSFASSTAPGSAAFIGGCLGGDFDADYSTPAVTCGAFPAYAFLGATDVRFDRAGVTALSLDVYAPDRNGDGLPDQASCVVALDGSAGVGIDLGDPTTVASCTATAVASVVPEPGSVALVALGLLGTAGVVRRRTRAAHRPA